VLTHSKREPDAIGDARVPPSAKRAPEPRPQSRAGAASPVRRVPWSGRTVSSPDGPAVNICLARGERHIPLALPSAPHAEQIGLRCRRPPAVAHGAWLDPGLTPASEPAGGAPAEKPTEPDLVATLGALETARDPHRMVPLDLALVPSRRDAAASSNAPPALVRVFAVRC
jgi:hypothetical protein